MTIRKQKRGDEPRWIIDIPYRTADGRRARYRRDAQVQTKFGAEAEHRRLITELTNTGTLASNTLTPSVPEDEAEPFTFNDAVKYYRGTHMQTRLKPSTRAGYNRWFDSLLLPRFGEQSLADVGGKGLSELDAELVADELEPSTARFARCCAAPFRPASCRACRSCRHFPRWVAESCAPCVGSTWTDSWRLRHPPLAWRWPSWPSPGSGLQRSAVCAGAMWT